MTSQKTNDAGLPVQNTPKSTSIDTNQNTSATNTLASPLPNILSLLAVILATLATIVAGYIHGNMHLITVLKNATQR